VLLKPGPGVVGAPGGLAGPAPARPSMPIPRQSRIACRKSLITLR